MLLIVLTGSSSDQDLRKTFNKYCQEHNIENAHLISFEEYCSLLDMDKVFLGKCDKALGLDDMAFDELLSKILDVDISDSERIIYWDNLLDYYDQARILLKNPGQILLTDF